MIVSQEINVKGEGQKTTCEKHLSWDASIEESVIISECSWENEENQLVDIITSLTALFGSKIESEYNNQIYSSYKKYCIDHFIAVKYDGLNTVFIAGAEPSRKAPAGL